MKKIALIPISPVPSRIPGRDLLLVDGKPMVFYIAEACRRAGVFDAIYLNAEEPIFGKMAGMAEIKFYPRKPAQDGSSGDRFLIDFMGFAGPCYLTMAHPASPLLRPETIARFARLLETGTYDSLFSVEERGTKTVFGEETAGADPVRPTSRALAGWNTVSFMENLRRGRPGMPDPAFCGRAGFFPLSRMEALDADTWDELKIIEACLNYNREKRDPGKFVFHDKIRGIESDLRNLILRDGVTRYEDGGANVLHSRLDEIKRQMGPAPWAYVLAYTSTDQAALICQNPGEGARKHCHVTHDEWWLVVEGEFEWRLEDRTVKVKEGEIIFLRKGEVHHIVCAGDRPGIRLAFGGRDMEHIYVE